MPITQQNLQLVRQVWKQVFGLDPVVTEMSDVYDYGPGIDINGIEIYPHPDGFEVGITVMTGGSRDCPPDGDYKQLGTASTFPEALRQVVAVYASEIAQNAISCLLSADEEEG